MKTRVAFFVSTLESGGPTNVVYNIIKYIDRNRVEPFVITMSPEPGKSSKRQFEKMDVRVYQANQDRWETLFSHGSKLKAIFDETKPHIVHSHSLRPDVFSSQYLNSYKRFTTLHADLHANYKNTYGAIVGSLFASRQLKAVAGFDRVISCSNTVYELYRQRFPAMISIQNGVDREIFRPVSAEERLQARVALKLPNDKKIFVTVGSLCERKDPATVIKGFLATSHAHNSILLILGTGKLEAELKDNFSGRDNIVFVGFTSEVKKYMQACDYFISASLSEGLPNTVLEALSSGIPVCLSRIPSHEEILVYNRNAGETFVPGDLKSLSAAIEKLLSSDYSAQVRASIEIVDSELNAQVMAKKYEREYLQI